MACMDSRGILTAEEKKTRDKCISRLLACGVTEPIKREGRDSVGWNLGWDTSGDLTGRTWRVINRVGVRKTPE